MKIERDIDRILRPPFILPHPLEAFPKDHCHIIDDAKNDTDRFHKRYELFLSQIKEKAKHHFPVDKNTKSKKKVVVDN